MNKNLLLSAILLLLSPIVCYSRPTVSMTTTADQSSLDKVAHSRISGKVIDENGDALPGAHIILKGRNIGTITDVNGEYSLNVPDGSVLVISYLGYEDLELVATRGTNTTSKLEVSSIEELNEVVVRGIKAQKNAPFAVANVKQEELSKFSKTGKELPILFTRTPGVIAWGENGLGTGSVYMRIRGAADSRINVTLDGVPLNSPEDQCVFWANMNSYASLLGSAQIQRGVGTSTNGDGAFGGTIALTSKAPDTKKNIELSTSYGSFNTYNVGGSFSTGLIKNHFIFDGAYHETNTDGFMHGTSGRSGSYYGGLAWIEDNLIIRFKNFGNFEKTGQAWNGVDSGELLDWNYGGMGTGIKGYEDFYKAGLGRYNTLYEHLVDSYDPSAGTERYKMADGSFWPKATDNFWQNRSLLSLAMKINDNITFNSTLHYTHGYGYYNEFRYNNKLSKFGLANYKLADGSTLKKTDFVRKKGMTQDQVGLVSNINYKNEKWDVVGGLSLSDFTANHFGYLTYIANSELSSKILKNGKYQYYDSDAEKFDASMFVKTIYKFNDEWSALVDIQYRHVDYTTDGKNDKFYSNADGSYSNQILKINKHYNFWNPKAGISYQNEGHHAYASFALSHREPERNNFTDNGSYEAPKAESLLDYEAGYNYDGSNWKLGVNVYIMDYNNQFIKTGDISDIGENLTTNIKNSYRLGVELTAAWNITKWLTFEGNAALSQNKIKNFDETVDDWDNGSQTIHYDKTDIAMSPAAILNGFIDFHMNGFSAEWHTNYVSRQYLDNTSCDQRSLPAFSTSNISLGYALQCNRKFFGLKEVIFGLNINNVFNRHYAASGWVYSAIYASGGNPNDNRYTEIGYIPSAGTTAMGSVTLRF